MVTRRPRRIGFNLIELTATAKPAGTQTVVDEHLGLTIEMNDLADSRSTGSIHASRIIGDEAQVVIHFLDQEPEMNLLELPEMAPNLLGCRAIRKNARMIVKSQETQPSCKGIERCRNL
jgi:anaerobic glycerol-3-phosphate dehydrogenase